MENAGVVCEMLVSSESGHQCHEIILLKAHDPNKSLAFINISLKILLKVLCPKCFLRKERAAQNQPYNTLHMVSNYGFHFPWTNHFYHYFANTFTSGILKSVSFEVWFTASLSGIKKRKRVTSFSINYFYHLHSKIWLKTFPINHALSGLPLLIRKTISL